jgi:hypothetical protein
MFPTNVRERLYHEQEEQEKYRHRDGNLKTFLRDRSGKDTDDVTAATVHRSKPLADLFLETTVLVSCFVSKRL